MTRIINSEPVTGSGITGEKETMPLGSKEISSAKPPARLSSAQLQHANSIFLLIKHRAPRRAIPSFHQIHVQGI